MKTRLLFFLLFFIGFGLSLQAQEYVNYQAVLFDDNGPIISSSVEVRIAISSGTIDSRTNIYKEAHTVETDDSGIVTLVIGSGNSTLGNWGTIDWSQASLWLETYLVEDGSEVLLNTSPLNASPKALYAAKAGSIKDGAVKTSSIEDNAITLDKIADGVIPEIPELTKEAIVALGIPSEDTNTEYTAGSNIVINDLNEISALITDTPLEAGDGLSIADGVITLSEDLVSLNASEGIETRIFFKRKNTEAPEEFDVTNYASIEEALADYHFYVGMPSDDSVGYSVAELIISDRVTTNEVWTKELSMLTADGYARSIINATREEGEEAFINIESLIANTLRSSQIQSNRVESEFIAARRLEIVDTILVGNSLLVDDINTLLPRGVIIQDQDGLVVEADKFRGDGSELTGITTEIDLSQDYQNIKGFYVQNPDFTQFSFEDNVVDVISSPELASEASTLHAFTAQYLDGPNEDIPLVVGQAGTDDNPKGLVFASSIAGSFVASDSLMSREINADHLSVNTRLSIIDSNTSLPFTVLSEEDDGFVLRADKFIGDGSELTGIVPAIADGSITPPKLNLTEQAVEIAHTYVLNDGVTLPETANLEEEFWEDWNLFFNAVSTTEDIFSGSDALDDWMSNSTFRYYNGPITTFQDETYFLRTDFVAALQAITGDILTFSITLGTSEHDFAWYSDDGDTYTRTSVLQLDSELKFKHPTEDVYTSVIYPVNDDEFAVRADRFIGDGSQLTGVSADILDSSITTEKLVDASITSAKLADDSITNSKISSTAAIDFSKLAISKADIEGLGISSVSTLDDLPNFYNPTSSSSFLIDALGEIDDTNFNSATHNLGLGFNVFPSLTKGDYNISLGYSALESLTAARENIAIGLYSLGSVTGNDNNRELGSHNIGLGYAAGGGITTGAHNIAIGYQTLTHLTGEYTYTGDYNIAIGAYAGYVSGQNYTAGNSIFIGSYARPVSSDAEGIAIGSNAITANASVALGKGAQAFENESIAIGNGSYAGAANRLALGGEYNSSTSKGINSIVNTSADIYMKKLYEMSDRRLKDDIQSIDHALDITSRLNPVFYSKRRGLNSDVYEDKEYGFIAQEVQEILPELVKDTGGEDHILSLDYNSIIAILTKAVQEQQSEIDELKAMVKQLLDQKNP